ncbi:type II toxin-antitoxin system death-on-curing family toxin [Neisseriaceae bacterium ESL0693]|nr:type II toxin-antitoxin system death-on-curing family toxin [Neisseriaceae bacterium ESL0693]
MEFAYLTANDIIRAHDKVIEDTGGSNGILNEGLIESIADHIKNDEYYPFFSEKLAHLIFSLIKNHCFCDANKRTSLSCGAAFLFINGFRYEFVVFFITHMEDMVVWIAEDKVSKETLKLIIGLFIFQNAIKLGEVKPVHLKADLEKTIDSVLVTCSKRLKKIKDKYPLVTLKWAEEDKKEYDEDEFNIKFLEKLRIILNGEYSN